MILPGTPPNKLIEELSANATNEEIIEKINEIILNINYTLEPFIIKETE